MAEAGPTQSVSETDGERAYDRFRDYVVHEDDLINQRTTWMITVQSFIVATFGFGVQKKLEVASGLATLRLFCSSEKVDQLKSIPIATGQLDTLLYGLCLLGGVIAYFTLRSVNAAASAIEHLKADWDRAVREFLRSGRGDELKFLPGLTGGGSSLAASEGFQLPTWLPLIFVWGWVVAFLTLIGIRVGFFVIT